MSDTPRTDAEYERLFEIYQNAERINGPLCCAFENDMRLCRQLELELKAANERIKRLEDALDLVRPTCLFVHHSKKHQHKYNEPCPVVALIEEAKEAKP